MGAGFERTSGYFGRYGPGVRNPELKWLDSDILDVVVAQVGAISSSIVLIPQGVTESTRVGRKCTITNIGWRISIGLPEIDAAVTPAQGDIIRCMLIHDRQCNGAYPAVTDVLEDAQFQSFNNLANKSRFRTLMDRSYAINYTGMASDGAGVVSQGSNLIEDSYFKKVNIPIEYDGATGAVTEIKSNNLFCLFISDTGSAGVWTSVRVRFSDS